MADNFVVRPKRKKDEKYVIMTIRMERQLQEGFNKLAEKSDHSRNELMCMALRFALDHLEFIPNEDNGKGKGSV